ncbi:hypothetical protein [Shouchella lehensis]|uniref:hypothetical protein n=1 Tax=Shouchella lehensis TaxID=300825 RepID=UPI00106849FB|nr:hypothetical protein [Shouchella lehensis]
MLRYFVSISMILLFMTGCNSNREEFIVNLEVLVLGPLENDEYMLEIVHLDESRYMDRHPVAYIDDPFEEDVNLYLTKNGSVNVSVETDMSYSITVFETTLTEKGEGMNLHQNKGNPLWGEEVLINDDTKQLIDLN